MEFYLCIYTLLLQLFGVINMVSTMLLLNTFQSFSQSMIIFFVLLALKHHILTRHGNIMLNFLGPKYVILLAYQKWKKKKKFFLFIYTDFYFLFFIFFEVVKECTKKNKVAWNFELLQIQNVEI